MVSAKTFWAVVIAWMAVVVCWVATVLLYLGKSC